MTETVFTILNMQVKAGEAETAAQQLERLTKAANDVDAAFTKTGSSVSGALGRQSKAVTDAAALEQTLLERNGAFRAAQIIRQVRDADKAAASKVRAESDAANIERTLIERNAAFRATAIAREVREADQAATAKAKAAQEAADLEQTLMERNMAFRAANIAKEIQQEQQAAADRARIAQQSADLEQTLQQRNASFRASMLVKQAQDEERAAREVATLASRYESLRAQLDPLAGVQLKLAQNTKLLDDSLSHGAISADQHAQALSQVTRQALAEVQTLDRLQKAHGTAGEAAKLQSYQLLNLGRQGADVFVSLASGQAIWMVAIQQGAQIGEIFADAATQGVGLKAALAGIAAQVAPFLPLIAALGATAAALALVAVGVKRNLDNQEAVRTFTGQLALNVDGLNYNAQALAATSKELAHFGLSAKDASAGLSTFVGAGVDASKLKDFSIAAKSLSEVSTAFKDVKSAQEAVSTAFTGGFDAVDKLDQKLNFLTVSQYEHIKAMFDAGRASDAQAEAFKAFSDQVDDAADKARGPWKTATQDLSGAWGDLLDNFANTNAIQGATLALETLMRRVAAALRMGKEGAEQQASVVPSFMRGGPQGSNLDFFGSFARLGNQRTEAAFFKAQADGLKAIGSSGGGDSPAAKAYSRVIDELNLQVDQAKKINDVERVRLAAEKKVAEAAEKGVSGRDPATGKDRLDIVREKAASIEQAKIDKERASAAKTSGAAANRAQRVDNRGDNAIEAAKSAELAAQTALTRNVEQIAAIKAAQIAQELKTQEVRLAGQVKAKEISQTDADVAIGSYRVAAGYKAQALSIETANQISQRDLQQRQEVLGYTQRVAQLQAAAAPTLEQANAIEAKALAERQAYDRDALQDAVAQRVVSGEITLTKGKLLLTEQKITQAADAEDKARQDRLAIFQRDLELAQAASANEVDILNSRRGLAQSSYEASRIERQILEKTYAAERDRLTKIIANKDTDAKTLTESQGRLVTIEEIHKNELRQLELSDNAVTAYADLVGALSNAARAVIDGDIGGSISAAGGVFKQLSGLAGGLGTSLGSALGSAAAYAGPIGAAVSAVTGVLGAIGDKSAAKAQAKLDALNKSVEALRADNKTSSGSIAGALEQANKAWNSDLEYTSQMVTSLRSIDNQIGALANALSRQIAAGGLLSTSTLGLGTTSQGPSTGTVLASGLIAKILPGLFGSKTNTELLDQGLAFNPTTYGQGVTGSTYADIVSTTTKKFLGVTTGVKVRNSTVSGAIDPSLLSQINGIIEALGNGVLSAASVFGVEAAKAAETALGSAVIDLGKLSLKDLKPDEIAAVLQATFDKVGDQLAAAGVPGLDTLATVGEGAFETLTRLAREYEVVDTSLQAIGKTFGAVGLESIAARDALVQMLGGIDEFSSKTSFFAQNFLTEAERLAPVQSAVAAELSRLGVASDITRDQFKSLVLGLDVSTQSGAALYAALLSVAPAFDKVASASEAVLAQRQTIQDRIDELTLTSAELTAKARAKEMAEAMALSDSLGPLLQRYYDLQDAAARKEAKDADLAEAEAARATAAAADARYENAERTRQAEAARAAAEIATKAFDDLVASVTAARNALVKAGDIAGYMAGERSINPGVSPGAYSGAGGFDAAGFNLAYSAQQSRLAQDLLGKTSASALDVKDVMGVIGGLTDIIQSPLLTDGIAAGVRAGLSDGLSAGGIDKVGVAISGLVDTLSSQAVNQAYSTDVGGITSVLAAQNKAAIAGVFGSVGGLSLMGADVIAFHTALDKLDRAFDAGQISAEDYTRATDNVRAAMGSTLDIASDFTAQQERYADALASLGRAGLDSIAYYFGQIDAAAAALAVSAAAAEEPISLVADAIGRLTSIRDVLGQSAIAAYQGGNATGSMSQAALIAQSAAIAAQALTTSDAAGVAAQIAGNAAFAAVDAAGIRDASLLLDGLKAFDAKSFEAAFLRINDALIDGAINEEQYSALFGTAMATYTDEIGKTTEAFAALRSSAKSLADSLLIDPALTSLSASQQLAEAQRQYRATYNGAMGGDQQAVGAYDGAARSLLSAGKASFATREEYDLLLAGVVSDARFAQDAAPINPYIEANAPIVTELKALREEVAGLRAENKATNEKIALNTSAQRRLAEDAAVNGQLVVTE